MFNSGPTIFLSITAVAIIADSEVLFIAQLPCTIRLETVWKHRVDAIDVIVPKKERAHAKPSATGLTLTCDVIGQR